MTGGRRRWEAGEEGRGRRGWEGERCLISLGTATPSTSLISHYLLDIEMEIPYTHDVLTCCRGRAHRHTHARRPPPPPPAPTARGSTTG